MAALVAPSSPPLAADPNVTPVIETPRPTRIHLPGFTDDGGVGLAAERDAYRAQATAAIEALCDLGRGDLADAIVG